MGDHRCIITLAVEDFHGVSRQIEMNINWNEADDSRITDWLEEVHCEGLYQYREQMADYFRKQDEERERAEFERLKAKFENAARPKVHPT